MTEIFQAECWKCKIKPRPYLVNLELLQHILASLDAGRGGVWLAGDALDPIPLVDHQGGVAIVEPGDVADPGQPDRNAPDKRNMKTEIIHYGHTVLPCVEVEATKEHHGDDEDRSDGEGDVGTGGDTGEEISEWHDHLQYQYGDTQGDEEPLSIGVELSHPVEDGEQDSRFQDVQRQLHDLPGEEVDVSPIGPIGMLSEGIKYN